MNCLKGWNVLFKLYDYGITSDNNCYTTGKLRKDKDSKEYLSNCKYFTLLSDALTDVYRRLQRECVGSKDMTLKEALRELHSLHKEFAAKIEEVVKEKI